MSRVLVFLPSLAAGGAERVTLDLCRALGETGDEVVLVVADAVGPMAATVGAEVGPSVRVVDLAARRTVGALLPLTRLLRRERPEVVVGVLAHAGLVATAAHRLARSSATLVVVLHNQMSLNVRHSVRRRDRVVPLLCRLAFRRVDAVCAVSQGVADDAAALTGTPVERVHVLPNPIRYDRIAELAQEPLPPDVRRRAGDRLLVACGRLHPQKDFATLLDAVRALEDDDWHLVVLGEGPERAALERQVGDLGLGERVSLPGHVTNPYPWFRAADAFVLSSRWEGLPTVLLEVLAFDTPVVSTDCPSGPREILDGGRHGRLVPVGDAPALAAAIRETLAAPLVGDRREVREEFSPPRAAALFRDVWAAP